MENENTPHIPRQPLFARLLKQDSRIDEADLDFLDERLKASKVTEAESQNQLLEVSFDPPLKVKVAGRAQPQTTEAQEPQLHQTLLTPLPSDLNYASTQEPSEADIYTSGVIVKKEWLDSVSEREALAKLAESPEQQISLRFFAGVMLAACIALALFAPKIYLRSQIYYQSREIIALQAQLDSLKEENRVIARTLEDIKFRNLTNELEF